MSLASITTPSHISSMLQHGKNVESKQLSILSSGHRGKGGLRVFVGKSMCVLWASSCVNEWQGRPIHVWNGERGCVRVCVWEWVRVGVCEGVCSRYSDEVRMMKPIPQIRHHVQLICWIFVKSCSSKPLNQTNTHTHSSNLTPPQSHIHKHPAVCLRLQAQSDWQYPDCQIVLRSVEKWHHTHYNF